MTNFIEVVQSTALITAAIIIWAYIDTAVRCQTSEDRKSTKTIFTRLEQGRDNGTRAA